MLWNPKSAFGRQMLAKQRGEVILPGGVRININAQKDNPYTATLGPSASPTSAPAAAPSVSAAVDVVVKALASGTCPAADLKRLKAALKKAKRKSAKVAKAALWQEAATLLGV
jgi:hypothetical protein